MIFFSNLIGSKIVNPLGDWCGKVVDVVAKPKKKNEFLPVVGLIITHRKKGKNYFIASEYIEGWAVHEIVLKKTLQEITSPMPEGSNFILLGKTVLDRQIVDLAGVRVVRVNDLQLAKVGETMCVVALDVSGRALLRRLGIEKMPLLQNLKPHLLEWKNVRVMQNQLQLGIDGDDIVKLHPADIANIVETMNLNQGSELLGSLNYETAAKVLEEIQPDIKKLLVKKLGTDISAAVMSKMSVDELVDLIQILPNHDSKEILAKLPFDTKTQKVRKILEYEEDTAGGLMTTEFVTAKVTSTVEQVIESIKHTSDQFGSIYFVYILSHTGQFKGVVSLRRIIMAEKHHIMKNLMSKKKRFPAAHENQSLKSLATEVTKYNLMSIAVLDKNKKMIGIVTVDDIMRRLVPQA